MTVRRMEMTDLEKLKEIHEKFYKNEFEFPEFDTFQTLVIIEKNGKIITGGGIRPIAESIIITDKDFSVENRYQALCDLLGLQLMDCHHLGYDALHCFIQDPTWRDQLIKTGFARTKGEALVLVL